MFHMTWLNFNVFSSLFQAHSKISEMFNEVHFKCVVSDIITGAIKESDVCFPFVQKLRERLERSSTEIFPFFEACSRIVQTHMCQDIVNNHCKWTDK